MEGGGGSSVISSWNAPESVGRGQRGVIGYTLLQGIQDFRTSDLSSQGTGSWPLLISVIFGGKKASAVDQTQMVRQGVVCLENWGCLVHKVLSGEGAGSVEMVSVSMKRRREYNL